MWLAQTQVFKEPELVKTGVVKARLRLIYQQWPSEQTIAGSNCLPMAKNDMEEIMTQLDLPRCFLYDFANKKSVPLRTTRSTSRNTLGVSHLTPYSCREPVLTGFIMQELFGRVRPWKGSSCPWL